MSAAPIETTHGLTAVQQGMLFHFVEAPQSGVDVEQMVATFRGPAQPRLLERAFGQLVRRHPVLRSHFRFDGLAEPEQVVVADAQVALTEVDLRQLPAPERIEAFETLLREDRSRGVTLSQAPLCRLLFCRLGDDDSRLVWTFPHIILDGGAFERVLTEWFEAYDALQRGDTVDKPAPRPYADHVAWLKPHLAARAEQARAHFAKALQGFAGKNDLLEPQPPDSNLATGARLFGEARKSLDLDTSDRLRKLGVHHQLSLNNFVQAAWALVVADFSAQEDVVFGVVRGCRGSGLPEARDMVGLFINTLPLRARVAPERPTLEWLRELRESYRALRDFEFTPLSDVARAANLGSAASLFDSVIVFNERRVGALLAERGGALAQCSIDFIEQTNFPLTLFAYAEAKLELLLSYDPGKMGRARAEAMMARLAKTLSAFAAGIELPLGELDRVPATERDQVARGNATKAQLVGPLCVADAFTAQVQRTPDNVAVVFGEESLTYRELNRRANRLARRLAAEGVGPDDLVGINVERSLPMVVGLLGILKAGGAYVPLDPSYPSARIAMMLEDAKPKAVVGVNHLFAHLPPHTGSRITLDDLGPTDDNDDAAPAHGAHAGSLAYVIFTSGSTGRPKGVMVEHGNVINFFAGMDARLGTRPGVWLAVTSISFDISVLELLWTLCRGFKVVVQQEVDKAALGRRASAGAPGMQISLFYFASDAGGADVGRARYRLLTEGAKFADQNGFTAVWTPERHFHAFGGLYPNPALTSAAIATITERVQLRAGSVVLPLHNPIRVAEDWSLVDNLSNGRVGLSFASGWHADDFSLMPGNYEKRRELMFEYIETVKKLWRGESVPVTSGSGATIQVKTLPRPVQAEPPILDHRGRQRGHLQGRRLAGRQPAHQHAGPERRRLEKEAGRVPRGPRQRGLRRPWPRHADAAHADRHRRRRGQGPRAQAVHRVPAHLHRPGEARQVVLPGLLATGSVRSHRDTRQPEPRGRGRHPGARLRALLRDARPVRHARKLPADAGDVDGDWRRRDCVLDRLRCRRSPRSGESAPPGAASGPRELEGDGRRRCLRRDLGAGATPSGDSPAGDTVARAHAARGPDG